MTRLPVVLKGIVRADDARRAVDAGVAGIVGQWTSYRNFNFAYGNAQITDTDAAKSAVPERQPDAPPP